MCVCVTATSSLLPSLTKPQMTLQHPVIENQEAASTPFDPADAHSSSHSFVLSLPLTLSSAVFYSPETVVSFIRSLLSRARLNPLWSPYRLLDGLQVTIPAAVIFQHSCGRLLSHFSSSYNSNSLQERLCSSWKFHLKFSRSGGKELSCVIFHCWVVVGSNTKYILLIKTLK